MYPVQITRSRYRLRLPKASSTPAECSARSRSVTNTLISSPPQCSILPAPKPHPLIPARVPRWRQWPSAPSGGRARTSTPQPKATSRTSRTPGSQPYGYSQQLPWRRPTPPRQAQLLRCAAAWQPGPRSRRWRQQTPCDIPRPPQVFHGKVPTIRTRRLSAMMLHFACSSTHAPSFHTIKKVRGRNTHDSRMSSGVANRFTRHHRTGPWVVISPPLATSRRLRRFTTPLMLQLITR